MLTEELEQFAAAAADFDDSGVSARNRDLDVLNSVSVVRRGDTRPRLFVVVAGIKLYALSLGDADVMAVSAPDESGVRQGEAPFLLLARATSVSGSGDRGKFREARTGRAADVARHRRHDITGYRPRTSVITARTLSCSAEVMS